MTKEEKKHSLHEQDAGELCFYHEMFRSPCFQRKTDELYEQFILKEKSSHWKRKTTQGDDKSAKKYI